MTDPDLRADCARCFALCCVVPAFARSADFAIDKPAGTPCPNLHTDFRCGIHTTLRRSGFTGCTGYDCFGAGQHVAQVSFAGRDWRTHPELREQMFAVFPVVRQLHELLFYLTAARALPAAQPVHAELDAAIADTRALTDADPATLLALDVDTHRQRVNPLLGHASDLARAGVPHRKDRRGADLIGKDLRTADLRGASLRGAYLIGADLRHTRLALADVTGADLRGANVSGTDLTEVLFLSQTQLDSAQGDPDTRIPAGLTWPTHWR